MSKTEGEIITPNKSALATQEELPEYLRSQVGHQAGMEDVAAGDLLIPRLGLCQALSPQKRKSHASYIDGLLEGQLFNTVTQEIYGDSLTVVALYFFKNRIKYFDIADGGGIDCISANGVDGGRISPDGCSICKYSTWGNGEKDDEHGNDAPECTLYHNFMSFVPSENSPLAISYKSTGLKLSKELLSKVRITRLPMYAKYWNISVVTKSADNNEWFEKKILPAGFVPSDLFAECEKQFAMLKAASIKVDTTGEDDGDTSFPPTKDF